MKTQQIFNPHAAPFSCTLLFLLLGISLAQGQALTSMAKATAAVNGQSIAKSAVLSTNGFTVGTTTSSSSKYVSPNTSLSSTIVAGAATGGITGLEVLNRQKFSYYNGYYAYFHTVTAYKGVAQQVPLFNHIGLPSNKIPPGKFMAVYEAVKYFNAGMPDFQYIQYAPPSDITIDLGMSRPDPIWVNPLNQTYSFSGTQFIRQVNLTVR